MTKRYRVAVLLVVVAAAAVVVWFTMRGRRHSDVTAKSVATGSQTVPTSTAVAARTPGGPDDLVFLNDADRAGSLRLEGQVIDERDQPVAGAEVTVSTNPPRTVASEQDGSFVFERLVGRSYDLVARAPSGFVGPVAARLTAKSEPVILKLRPAAAIDVQTVGPSGAPIAGASVELRGVVAIATKTGSDGHALATSVGAGKYTLVAWAAGYAKTYEELRVPSATKNGDVVARVKIALRPGMPVAGRVLAPDGKPLKGAVVRFTALADFRERGDVRRDAVSSDEEGRFRFDALPRGTFRFLATHDSYGPGSSRPVELDGVHAQTDVEIRMEPAATLAGRVVSKDGSPIAFATIRLTADAVGFAYDAPRQTYSDQDGEFEITGLSRRPMVVVASHESATSDLVHVDLAATPQKRDLVIVLDQTGTIGGSVVDDRGQPIAGVTVWADPINGSGDERFRRQLRGVSQELTDSAGHFAIHGLSPGEYFVFANRNRGMKGGDTRAGQGTRAKVGDTSVKLVLPEEGGIAGTVAFTDGSPAPVFTVRVDKAATPFVTSDGHFLITGLAVGPATVTISGPNFDPVTRGDVLITSGKPTDLGHITVEKGRVISGHVLDADGKPVSGARIYAGARIFGNGAQAGSIDLNLPGARDAVMIQATSEDDGSYSLHGVGINDLTIMAEHDTRGRSKLQAIAGSKESSTIDLVLQPFAVVQGTVTQHGQPAPDVPVSATSTTVSTSTFLVSTGADGTFRFDHLAPDTYKVSAVTGRSPKLGFGFSGATVTATSGQTVNVQLSLDDGPTLLVNVSANGGKTLKRAIVYVMTGSQPAANAKVLAASAASSPGFSFIGAAVAGSPARVESIPAGHYSACAVAIPNEVDGMAKAFAYVDRVGATMPAVCAQVDVRDAPPEQQTSLSVDIPPYVPPPDGTQDPGGSGAGGGSGSSGTGKGGAPRQSEPSDDPDAYAPPGALISRR